MKKRYRTIVKVFCPTCLMEASNGIQINVKCSNCNYLKYQNVNDLVSFTKFLDTSHPRWVYFNVFEYIKGSNGKLLGSYKNFGERKVPIGSNEL